jgi:hypothetical protein
MGSVVPSGNLMAAAVALLADDGSGTEEASPPSFTIAGTGSIGDYPAREFRRDSDGALFVLQRVRSSVVSGTKYWLVVVWTAATTRATALPAFQALVDDLGAAVVNRWRVTQAANGQLVSATLDTFLAGTGAIPTAVKAAWPDAWTADGAGAAPRFIGDVVA